jgi:hypothetical protein
MLKQDVASWRKLSKLIKIRSNAYLMLQTLDSWTTTRSIDCLNLQKKTSRAGVGNYFRPRPHWVFI